MPDIEDLISTPSGPGRVTFSWSPVPGAETYEYRLSGGSRVTVTVHSSVTSATFPGMGPGDYTFYVWANLGSGPTAEASLLVTILPIVTNLTPVGPRPDQTPSGLHDGAYLVASGGEYRGFVSLSARFTSNVDALVKIRAKWLDAAGAEISQQPLGEVRLGASDFLLTRDFKVHTRAPAGAYRWLPIIGICDPATPDQAPTAGSKIRMDRLFIPDNGYPIVDPDYIDGDQPGCVWEGEWSDSSSTFGIPASTSTVGVITLDEDLPALPITPV